MRWIHGLAGVGSARQVLTCGTTADLEAVWGPSESDVFVVGESATILRYGL